MPRTAAKGAPRASCALPVAIPTPPRPSPCWRGEPFATWQGSRTGGLRPSYLLPSPERLGFLGRQGFGFAHVLTRSVLACGCAPRAAAGRALDPRSTPALDNPWGTDLEPIRGGHCTLSTTTGNGLLPPGEGGGSGVSPRGVSGRSPEHVVQVSQGVAEGGSRGNRWMYRTGEAGFVRTARDLSATSCRSAVRGRCGFQMAARHTGDRKRAELGTNSLVRPCMASGRSRCSAWTIPQASPETENGRQKEGKRASAG